MPKRPTNKPPRKPARPKTGPAMTAQQRAFVDEYLVDLNGTQAAIRVGYSPRTARQQGVRLLSYASIKAAVEAAIEARNQRTEITQDKVLTELTILAHSDVDDYQVKDGRLCPAEGKPQSVMKAVSSVKYKTRTYGPKDAPIVETSVEFRLWDKPNTLKLEGRHVGLFPNEVKWKADEDTLAAVLGRAAARPRR